MDSKGKSTTRLLLFLFTLSGVAVLVGSQATGSGQKLLLILLDGFRHDYMDQSELPLPGFHKIAQLGVRAQGFVPVFPSESYPNYYSIMTGVFCVWFSFVFVVVVVLICFGRNMFLFSYFHWVVSVTS